MRITDFVFRFRVLLIALSIFAGFALPWSGSYSFGKQFSLMVWLAAQLFRHAGLQFEAATAIVISVTILLAFIGAFFRVWGTAYLSVGVVNSAQMHGEALQASGPYRFVRNPLYLGSWFVFASLVTLMQPLGALFTFIAISVIQILLIIGEEAHLAKTQGEAYLEYKKRVPRLIPNFLKPLAAGTAKAEWLNGLLGEIFPLGNLLLFATLSWYYNNKWMVQGVLIAFGVSLIVRALLPRKSQA